MPLGIAHTMRDAIIPYVLYLLCVFALMGQYRHYWSKFTKRLFFCGTAPRTTSIAILAGLAFVINFANVHVAVFSDKSAQSDSYLSAALYVQSTYYILQWFYVPSLLVLINLTDETTYNMVRTYTIVLLQTCAVLQIFALVLLCFVAYSTSHTHTAVIVMQSMTVLWTVVYDGCVYTWWHMPTWSPSTDDVLF